MMSQTGLPHPFPEPPQNPPESVDMETWREQWDEDTRVLRMWVEEIVSAMQDSAKSLNMSWTEEEAREWIQESVFGVKQGGGGA